MRLDVVRDPRDLAALKDPWTELLHASRDRSPFVSWEWADAWMRTVGKRDRAHVLVVRRGADAVAIAPLLQCAGVGRYPPVYLGLGQEVADYGGFLLGQYPEESGRLIFDHLDRVAGRGAVVIFTRLHPDGDHLRLVESRYGSKDRGLVVTSLLSESYPYLDLTVLNDPARHVARKRKANDVDRRLRRLSELHKVEFTYHRSPATDPTALSQFFRLHATRWAVKQGQGAVATGLFASPAGREFLVAAAEATDRAGWLRLSFVDIDGQPAIGRFGMEFEGCYYGLKSAFDPDWSAYGPGHLVVGMLLEEAVARNLERFDFMRGAGEHKKAWAGGSREVNYYALHRRGPVGRAQLRYAWSVLRWRNRARSGAPKA